MPFIAAAVLALTFLTLPGPAPDDEADPSLNAVLNYAHAHGFQFGTEIVYTYGPLGFLIFPYFSSHAPVMRMLVAVGLCYHVALGLCLMAWRLRVGWGALLWIVFAWVASNIEHRIDLVIDTGLFCWGLLCFVEAGRRLILCSAGFIALATFAALARTSFLFISMIGLVLLAGDLVARRQFGLAAGLVIGSCGAFCAGWALAGQNLEHIVRFITTGFNMVRAYNQALGWEGIEATRRMGFAVALCSGVLVLLRTLGHVDMEKPRGWLRRALLCCWMLFLTFTVWKHGLVRGDAFHAVFFLGFAPVLVLALETFALPGPIALAVGRGLCLITCVLALGALQSLFYPTWRQSLLRPLAAMRENLRCVIVPSGYLSEMEKELDARRRVAQLPVARQIIGGATTDLFGESQAFLLFNDLNYHPRPVFQSYAACSRNLMRLNEQFYRSTAAPEFVLFELGATDRKFPPLEDAWVLRDLLLNYAPATNEGRFVVLKAKSQGQHKDENHESTLVSDASRLTLLREGEVHAGEAIDLARFGMDPLWLEIEVRPSWVGAIREFLYRPGTVRLAAWRGVGKELLVRRRAPPSMLAAGFLASPLLMRNQDVLNLYTSNSIPHPAAYSVELLAGEEYLWRDSIRYRLFKIENALGKVASGTP